MKVPKIPTLTSPLPQEMVSILRLGPMYVEKGKDRNGGNPREKAPRVNGKAFHGIPAADPIWCFRKYYR